LKLLLPMICADKLSEAFWKNNTFQDESLALSLFC
jgi:hypothetical protein